MKQKTLDQFTKAADAIIELALNASYPYGKTEHASEVIRKFTVAREKLVAELEGDNGTYKP